eukprot:532335-Amphidinium_carterae.1
MLQQTGQGSNRCDDPSRAVQDATASKRCCRQDTHVLMTVRCQCARTTKELHEGQRKRLSKRVHDLTHSSENPPEQRFVL